MNEENTGPDEQSAYKSLVYSVFQSSTPDRRGLVVGLTSPHKGAGTSYLVQGLVEELGGNPPTKVLRVDLAFLARSATSPEDLQKMISATSKPTIFELVQDPGPEGATRKSSYWHGSVAHRRECIERLRADFQYVLFDCPDIQGSADTLGIAPLIDGLLLVVEANKTTVSEIAEAELRIESAGGRLLGSILNKQRSILPNWARTK